MTSLLLLYDECKHKSMANPLSHEADYAVWLNDEWCKVQILGDDTIQWVFS